MSIDGTVVQRIGREQTAEFLDGINRQAPWEAWAEKLAARKRPESVSKLFSKSKSHPLEWSLSMACEPASEQLVQWLARLNRRRSAKEKPGDWSAVISDWLETVRARPQCESLAIECVALAGALPRLAVRVGDRLWAELFAELVNTAVDAMAASPFDDADSLLVSQLLAGELPLTLAYMFPKVELCQSLGQRACVVVDEGLLKVLDGEGMPHAQYVPLWRNLLACWTRCMAIARRYRGASLQADARLQFEWLVRQTLRWRSGAPNLPMSAQFVSKRILDSLVSAALEVGGDRVDRELAKIGSGRASFDDSEYALPYPGEHSEWSELAILRSSWTRRAIHLAVTFNRSCMVSELSLGFQSVWRGSMMPEVRVDSKLLTPLGEFEETCWTSDEDLDYLELEIQLSDHFRLQRQLLLAREEQFLFMADAVLGEQSGRIEYCLPLPLDGALDWQLSEDHTEVQWQGAAKPIAWVLPLALSEWQVDRSAGAFDGRVLTQRGSGSALYAPLFFDFSPKRRKKTLTWRQLTVAENLQLLPPDVAVGYRVQIGKQQWVFYRSLAEVGNRTFIGQNLISEFLAARFHDTGETENLIEIE